MGTTEDNRRRGEDGSSSALCLLKSRRWRAAPITTDRIVIQPTPSGEVPRVGERRVHVLQDAMRPGVWVGGSLRIVSNIPRPRKQQQMTTAAVRRVPGITGALGGSAHRDLTLDVRDTKVRSCVSWDPFRGFAHATCRLRRCCCFALLSALPYRTRRHNPHTPHQPHRAAVRVLSYSPAPVSHSLGHVVLFYTLIYLSILKPSRGL